MNPSLCLKVGLSSRQKAEEYLNCGNVGRAFSHYLLALKLNPTWKPELKEQFNEVLLEWSNTLINEGRDSDAVTCYNQAIEVFPENELSYYNFALFLLKYNCYGVLPAIANLKQSIEIDPWNLKALRSLENVLNLAVERWHFRMLNDEIRNRAFWEAIFKKVHEGYDDVLDIGTGTGLLSLFAVESGAKNVIACDSSPVMTRLARDLINKYCADEVKIIEKHSTDLSVGDDLSDRVSLVVCEIVDSGLLGEHVLHTLDHAWKFLLKPSGKVIPFAATFYICGIESTHLSNKFVLKNFSKKLGLNNFILVTEESDYDTEHLELIPNSFRTLTDSVPVLSVNFNDLNDMSKILDGDKDVSVMLTCENEGELSCIAGWFDLQIDEEIIISTKFGSDVKCWDQAIFNCPKEMRLSRGKKLPMDVSFKDGKTKISFPGEKPFKEKVVVSQNVISMLNDVKYFEALLAAAEELMTRSEPACILDTSPFPVLGLSLVQSRPVRDKLVCVCVKPEEKRLVSLLAEKFGADIEFINPSNITKDLIAETFDVIYLSLIETTGELSELYLSQISEIRKLLKSNGFILPRRIEVYGQLIESDWIKRTSQVINQEVTRNYDIASFINQYKVDHQLDFRLESCNAIMRSEPFKIMDLYMDKLESQQCDYSVALTHAGHVDAMAYRYDVYLASHANLKPSFTTEGATHFNTSAFLIDLEVSNVLNFTTKYDSGILITKVYITK